MEMLLKRMSFSLKIKKPRSHRSVYLLIIDLIENLRDASCESKTGSISDKLFKRSQIAFEKHKGEEGGGQYR